MRVIHVAAWVIVVALAIGAAAPRKAETRPASRPSSPISESLHKDGLKFGMSEAECKAALAKANISEVSRRFVAARERTVILMSDNRELGFEKDKLVQVSRSTTRPTTKPG